MKRLALIGPVLALAACGSEPAPAPTPSQTPTVTGPRTLVAAGFDAQMLGPRIIGPQGDEVSDEPAFEGRTVAQIVSYVACSPVEAAADENAEPVVEPAGECIPGAQAEGALFTYVHRVTPGEEGGLMAFRTARSATGFANVIGFDRAQAEAALGEGYSISVQLDNGALIWRVDAGDGWDAGEELTFFWQSTLPPEGPSEAFELQTPTGAVRVTGPFPPYELPEAEESVDEVTSD